MRTFFLTKKYISIFVVCLLFSRSPQILSQHVHILANPPACLFPRPLPHVELEIKNITTKCLLGTISFISGEEMFWAHSCARVAGAGGVIERQQRSTVCTYMCIGVCVYVPLCACLNRVQLQSTCSTAGCCDVILPPLRCVFAPVWVTAL